MKLVMPPGLIDPSGSMESQRSHVVVAPHGCRTRVGQGYPRGPVNDLGGAGCPNLLQRPGSSRSTGGESLIFRASSHRRSRPGAPLQQIWTSPRPGSFQESHAPRRAGAPAAASPDEGGGRPCGAERSPRGAIFPLRTGPQGPAHEFGETHGRPGLGPPGRFSRARRSSGTGASRPRRVIHRMCVFRRFRVTFPPVLSCLMTSGSARCCDTSRAILGYGA